ncbi:hypothetical protein [Candidatus Parabeggiatoa sp. HSG14]|uniref:hypothetical protein n=1 Tax=Candidatus Parabeggiatoa sp. HSG14 TaxID=3055593 RepID=UPI0025A6A898|nr:hypothetical protein [Thiotrichales bacterium HSG14]
MLEVTNESRTKKASFIDAGSLPKNMSHRCHIHLAVNESNEVYTVHKTVLLSMLMQMVRTIF